VWYDEAGEAKSDEGAQLLVSMQQELQSRDVVIPVLTPQGWGSSWVRQEVQLALATRRQILSVMLQPTEIEGFVLVRPWLDAVEREPISAARLVSERLAALPIADPLRSPFPSGALQRALAADAYLSPPLLGPRRLLRERQVTRFVRLHALQALWIQLFACVAVLVGVLLLTVTSYPDALGRISPSFVTAARSAFPVAVAYTIIMSQVLFFGSIIFLVWTRSVLSGGKGRLPLLTRWARRRIDRAERRQRGAYKDGSAR
jgi:hypothetical protein